MSPSLSTRVRLWSTDSLTHILISSFNGQPLGPANSNTEGVGEISYFSPLRGRPRDNYMYIYIYIYNYDKNLTLKAFYIVQSLQSTKMQISNKKFILLILRWASIQQVSLFQLFYQTSDWQLSTQLVLFFIWKKNNGIFCTHLLYTRIADH